MGNLWFSRRYVRSTKYFPGDQVHLIAKSYKEGDRIIINGRLVTITAMTTKAIKIKRYGRSDWFPLYVITQDSPRRSGPLGHNPHCFMTIDDIFAMNENQLSIVGYYDETLAWVDNTYSLLSSGEVLRVGLANGAVLVGFPPSAVVGVCKSQNTVIEWHDSIDSECIEVNKGDSLYTVYGEV